MRKLLVTCECGQKMQVPRSAIGKMGMCPTCGKTTRISTANTTPLSERRRGVGSPSTRRLSWDSEPAHEPTEEAKQRFGQAVDYYYAQKYAESLAVFDGLAKEYPGNPDIEHGRQQCIRAMQRPQLGAPSQHQPQRLLTQGELDKETVRRVVLDKLLNGLTDAAQLQAAEIALKYFDLDAATKADDSTGDNDTDAAATQSREPENGAGASPPEPEEDASEAEPEDDEYSERIRRFPSEDAR